MILVWFSALFDIHYDISLIQRWLVWHWRRAECFYLFSLHDDYIDKSNICMEYVY